MTRREIRLERYDWRVIFYIGYTGADGVYLCQCLTEMGCRGSTLRNAYDHFLRGGECSGLTFSNVNERVSIVAIGASDEQCDVINTIGHELLHVVAHVCERNGIDMLDEEPCYMLGELCEKLFKILKEE